MPPINILNPNQLEDEDENQQYGNFQSIYTTSGASNISRNQQITPRTSGFTNIQRIAAANRPQLLGQVIGSGIRNIAQQAQQTLQQSQKEFQEKLKESDILGTEQDIEKRKEILSNITQGRDITPEDISTFERYRRGAYTGPQQLENQQEILKKAHQAESLAQTIRDESGKQTLLQRFIGSPYYTQGQQRLDTALLGLSDQQAIQQARRGTIGLQQNIQEKILAAQQQAQHLAQQAQEFAKETEQQIAEKQKDIDKILEQRVEQTKKDVDFKRQIFQDIRDLLQGKGLQEVVGPEGKIIRERVDPSKDPHEDINKALNLAQQIGYLTPEDINKIKELQKTLATPIQKFYKQKVISDPGSLLKRYTPEKSTGHITPGGYTYSQLKLGDVLAQALQAQEAENVTKEGLITEEETKKLQALRKLAGETDTIADSPKFKDYRAAFNFAKAFDVVEKDIAKLKGESIEELPSEYIETPFEEKLRRTLLPTPKELVSDIGKDLEDIFGKDVDPMTRLKGLARTALLTPVKIITAPISPALDVIGKVGHGVSNVVKDVGKTIKKIFCFHEDTPILMKNGSYKKIKDIKVGDEVFLGGKVTTIGSSIANGNIYDYQGQLITENHLILDNGKWKPVQESPSAKKTNLSKFTIVYIINTQKHLVVAGDVIASDFMESDDPLLDNSEEIKIELNKDKNKIKKLENMKPLLKEYYKKYFKLDKRK